MPKTLRGTLQHTTTPTLRHANTRTAHRLNVALVSTAATDAAVVAIGRHNVVASYVTPSGCVDAVSDITLEDLREISHGKLITLLTSLLSVFRLSDLAFQDLYYSVPLPC